MGCWHGGHGCRPSCGGPHGDWCEPADWSQEADYLAPWRHRRPGRLDPEPVTEELEMKLDRLGAVIRRMEAELSSLRGHEGTAGGSA
jgi:hypothetical protein